MFRTLRAFLADEAGHFACSCPAVCQQRRRPGSLNAELAGPKLSLKFKLKPKLEATNRRQLSARQRPSLGRLLSRQLPLRRRR